MNRIDGNTTSANALALSQENLRFLSCHGQINRTSRPPVHPSRAAQLTAGGWRDPDGYTGVSPSRGGHGGDPFGSRPWPQSNRTSKGAMSGRARRAALELDHRAARQRDLTG